MVKAKIVAATAKTARFFVEVNAEMLLICRDLLHLGLAESWYGYTYFWASTRSFNLLQGFFFEKISCCICDTLALHWRYLSVARLRQRVLSNQIKCTFSHMVVKLNKCAFRTAAGTALVSPAPYPYLWW